MVQPRVRRTTDTMPRKHSTPDEVLAALPRPRAANRPAVAVPQPRQAPPPPIEADLPKAPAPASDVRRGVLHRLWRIVTGLLLIATALASVAAMVTVMSQHLGFAPVLSPSMEPAFHPGDLVITKPEPVKDVKIGQVIALPVPSAPSQRYVHRVISVTTKDGKPLVRTKGDANPAPEPFTLQVNSPNSAPCCRNRPVRRTTLCPASAPEDEAHGHGHHRCRHPAVGLANARRRPAPKAQ